MCYISVDDSTCIIMCLECDCHKSYYCTSHNNNTIWSFALDHQNMYTEK